MSPGRSLQSRKRPSLWAGTLFGLLLCAAASLGIAEEPQQRFQFQQVHMGVDFTLIFYAPSKRAANQAANAAFARIAALNSKLSDYDPESELSRFSHTSGSDQEVPLSDDLWRVLVRAESLSAQTDGAFDVTVGPVVRLWRRARRQHELPSEERIAQALAAVGHQHITFDPQTKSVVLAREEMRLDLGAIAKGFATDEALRVLQDAGCPRAMVDGSGDLTLGDPPPEASGWRIAIAGRGEQPDKANFTLVLSNCGVATSGDVYQFIEIDGVRYSHIVDPKTGLGLTTPSSVTVVAADGMTADSLASAVSVLGPHCGIELVEETADAEAIVIVQQEGELNRYFSTGMAKLLGQEH